MRNTYENFALIGNNRMDSIYGMRILARVVEAGGFSAAARQLDLAPSSVSRQIQELEMEL